VRVNIIERAAAGLESIEAIAATPGLNGVFTGPVDLSLDLGLGLPDFTDLGVLAHPVGWETALAGLSVPGGHAARSAG
jgi:HpcH/HpaI aldolase/citrate lyase family